MANFSFAQLEGLWIQAGGDQASAPVMAAIALAESGGNPNATNHNSNGTEDEGLWQINTVWGNLQTFDPFGNAKAAVTIKGKQGLQAWSTFNSGAYKKFLNGAAPAPSGVSGSGGGGGGGGPTMIDVTGSLAQFLQWLVGSPDTTNAGGSGTSGSANTGSGSKPNIGASQGGTSGNVAPPLGTPGVPPGLTPTGPTQSF